jgi:pimeloyl-ACP methyl ester carboxylesterase
VCRAPGKRFRHAGATVLRRRRRFSERAILFSLAIALALVAVGVVNSRSARGNAPPDSQSRLPTLVWPREIPIEGETPDVVAMVQRYGKRFAQSTLPKLFFIGEPGRILVAGRGREFARSWSNQQVVTVKGVHHLQEDSPVEFGTALAAFVKGIRT